MTTTTRKVFGELLAFIGFVDPSNPSTVLPAGMTEDAAYAARNAAVAAAALCAEKLNIRAWIATDPAEPDRPVIIGIELPTGQVTWHLPAGYRRPMELICWDESPAHYDGHNTPEKYRRIGVYLARQDAAAALSDGLEVGR